MKISVLMSVYNTEAAFLKAALDSILNQTLQDFEFIIVDDKTTDGSLDILHEYRDRDQRIILIENEHNEGLTINLNKGLRIAKGKYIARMDADDISLPDRFEKQYKFMEEHPEFAACGGYVFIAENQGLINRGYNEDPEVERIQMLFRNAGLPHPTAFFRNEFLIHNGITYDEKIKKSQDYAIWLDIVSKGGVIGCVPEILLKYRVHEGQISSNSTDQMKYASMVTQKALNRLSIVDQETLELHCSLVDGIPDKSKSTYLNYLKSLIQKNQEKNLYDQQTFASQIRAIWLRLCMHRLRFLHKADFIFCVDTIKCLNPRTISVYKNTYVDNQKKYERVKKQYLEKRGR